MNKPKERGTPRAGNDITTMKVNLYYEFKGKWRTSPRLEMNTFEVILKAKKANGGPAAWVAESVLAYDPRPYNIKQSSGSLVSEMTKLLENKLGAEVKGITKLMIHQSYL